MEREARVIKIKLCIYSIFLLISLIINVIPVVAEPLELLIYKGNKNYSMKNYEEALSYYLLAEKKSDKTMRAVYNRANTLYKLENFTEAERAYIKAIETKKAKIKKKAYFNLGNTYFMLGDYQKAIDSYINALEIDPYDMDVKYNLELAWKKLEEQKKKPSTESNKKESKKSKEKNKQDKDKKESTGAQKEPAEHEYDRLTPEEAEKIINSVENNQDKILRDTILQKVDLQDEEKDW